MGEQAELTLPRVVYLTAGAAGMYCGSCMHDNTLVRALTRRGVDTLLVPTYTPIRTDELSVAQRQVFFGGITIYLQQKMPWLRFVPRPLVSWLDHPALIRWAASRAVSTKAADLAALSISMLEGVEGRQRRETSRFVRWLLRDARPDVLVLTNMLIAGCVPAIKQRADIPVLVTLQGDDVFLEELPAAARRQCLDRLQAIDRAVDGYIVNSHYYADFMASYLGVDRAKFHITPLGIDVEDFAVPDPPAERPVTIGYLARLAPEKGLHVLVDAFIQLRRMPEMADHPARLRIAGWLGEHRRAYAEQQFQRLRDAGLGDDFAYVGEIDRREKVHFLHSIDLLSVPTTYREPKGLYVLEALACGVPVVQPDHGAFPEMLESLRGGVLFSAGDSAALARELKNLALDEARRQQLGRQGAEIVRQRFHAQAMASDALRIYDNCLHGTERG